MQLRILLAAALLVVVAANGEDPCETSCGDLGIEFPFGSREGCYHNPEFLVTCNRSSGRPIPFFTNSTIVIKKISTTTEESEMEIEMFVAADCYNSSGRAKWNAPSLTLSEFRISTKNWFVAIGCDTKAFISGRRGTKYNDAAGCISYCGSNMSSMANGSCSGVGCCQVAIPYIMYVNECEDGNNGGCEHECVDLNGSYECRCPKGYKKKGRGCMKDELLIIQIVVGTLAAAIFLLMFVTWLYLGLKKRKLIMLKEKFFRQNGGIMLQQRISGEGSSHNDRAKVFTIEELKRATNNYDETRIIGKGGYGTVYKGVLSDKRIVAIKKSKLVDQTQSQIEQFINEVVILSQINHRNVVKLIGCCLETEVPLLVYEFISNGTLSDHIHNETRSLALTWDIRLRIATGTAGALSYLHSAASVPIIHRDVKPTNILVDDDYVAKVSDFGASKLIPMDQVELATIVQGTLGYLDPEYLQTNQLTDKSDVYSFGVVLVELLSGKQALSFDRPENERNLAMYFLSSLKEGRLFQVLDEHLLLNEGIIPNEIINVSRLAERCLCLKGDERPTMKEVAMELEGILASMIEKHPWVQSTSNEEEYEFWLKQVPMDHDFEFTNGAKASSKYL